jgi:hypothetical protein
MQNCSHGIDFHCRRVVQQCHTRDQRGRGWLLEVVAEPPLDFSDFAPEAVPKRRHGRSEQLRDFLPLVFRCSKH